MTALPETEEVRVRLRFPGGMILDYRTERAIAERLAAHLRPHRIEVTIDGPPNDRLPPLPCAELWTD
ncbi:hypothetical protein NS506_00962 [Nocardia seriolae]|uniref:Uncharacterized protein n=1 Tax=Nocardia seriolae TaxID=37332 RepID=A0ABC9Z2Q4_9NOCA|nr:hypothetical protein NS506_00962 [Nocardia seriolae]GAM49798.1 hypothetical protein NS07_v2contig00123-0011 [Nocardia seriolae]GAP31792.1 hypothetical protein NSK11_contig00127-0015 [Nocardia seriolae]